MIRALACLLALLTVGCGLQAFDVGKQGVGPTEPPCTSGALLGPCETVTYWKEQVAVVCADGGLVPGEWKADPLCGSADRSSGVSYQCCAP